MVGYGAANAANRTYIVTPVDNCADFMGRQYCHARLLSVTISHNFLIILKLNSIIHTALFSYNCI